MNKTILSNNRWFLLKYSTSYSILLIVILIMGLYMYSLGIRDAKTNLFEQSRSLLSQSVGDIDTSFKVMEALSAQIADNSSIITLEKAETSNDYAFYVDAVAAMKYLAYFAPSETILPISDYYIYMPKTDYLLSTTYFNRTDLYYRMNKSYDTSFYEEWLAIMNNEIYYFKFYNTFHFTQKETSSYLYLVPVERYTMIKNVPGVICFEIDATRLREIFANLPLFDTGFLYVVDEDSHIAFSLSEPNTPALSSIEMQKLLNELNDDSHFSSIELKGVDMLVTSITSSHNGWTYYMFQPEEMALSSLISYQRIYFMIIIAACIVSFIVILILSKKNVAPIIRIHTQLEDTLKEHTSLQQTLEAQKPIIARSYIERLITGQINNPDELDYILRHLNICTLNRKFCVLYITAYYVNDSSDYTDAAEEVLASEEPQNYRSLLMQEFYDTFGSDILIYESGENSFVLFLGGDGELSLDDATAIIAGQFLTLHKKIAESYPFYLFCGMGNRNEDPAYTWKSYQQAIQAVAHASTKAPFQAYKRIDKTMDGYYYPLEFAQKLTEFIASGNKKQVQEFLHLIYHENTKERSLTPRMHQFLLTDIRNTLLKFRFAEASEADSTHTPAETDLLLDEIDSILESSNIDFQMLSDIALKLTSLHEPKQQEGNKLILTIQEYIRTNYADSSLCLNKISDEFGISESYFSYLFKVETKTNFSEYLEQLRMDQALLLLQTTTIPISSLYLDVGYNNANSFRRAFKKVHGVSPKTVRDSAKNT